MRLISDGSSKSNTTGKRTTLKTELHYSYELRMDVQGHGWNVFVLCLVIQYFGDTCCAFWLCYRSSKIPNLKKSAVSMFAEICFYANN